MATQPSSKILIIEDDVIYREVYKRCLWEPATPSFEFAEAACAIDGIEMAAAWRPDCALVDVNLPDMDGIEALNRLQGVSGRIPFAAVVLTAYGEETVAVRAMKAGAMDYLPKRKVSADTLPHVVRNAIQRFLLRERLEEQRSALEDSAHRYQALLEAMPHMVWTANASGTLEYANRQWSEYTGFSPAEGARLDWDLLVHPDDRDRTRRLWRHAAETASIFEVEHRLRRAGDGSYRWHLARAVPVQGSAGQITNWFGTSTEVENQKRTEKAALEKQTFESLGRMAGGLAHDFNNLLVAILGGASYAMEKLPPTHPVQDTLQGVVQAGERAAEITRKMLAYAGKSIVRAGRVQVDQLVGEAVKSASVPQGIQLEFRAARRLPPAMTDDDLLRQAVSELLRNAVEAIGDRASGSISVRTGSVELGKDSARRYGSTSGLTPGKYVMIEVRDNGCGMDEETQKKIFDPFFSTKFPGRGLGLAAVQGFAHSNAGAVQMESSLGEGSRFRLLLPAAPENARGG